MNSRSTWLWLVLALGLAGFVFFIEPRIRPKSDLPKPVLTGFNARGVTSILIQPAGGPDIRAENSNGLWQITLPAQVPAIDAAPAALCAQLEKLFPDTIITDKEVRARTNGVAGFGLDPALFAVTLITPAARHQIVFGSRTAPGDQVYMQVAGREGVFVVQADILKSIPTNAAAWRDPSLLDLKTLEFNRVSVTNGPTFLELQYSTAGNRWRMTRPREQRADGARFASLLSNLGKMRAKEFVTDDPAADREAFGLQPPALSIALGVGTNLNTLLHFGKSPTNNPKLLYARNDKYPGVITVEKELLTPWLAPVNEFRDRKLIELKERPDVIEIRGGAGLSLSRKGDGAWNVAGESFGVDTNAVEEIFATLTNLSVIGFAQDVVIDPDLPRFGLAPAAVELRLFKSMTNTTGPTNFPIASLSFGKGKDGRVFVRRSDEDSVYEVSGEVASRLPSTPFQMRERRLWNFSENDVARVTIQEAGRSRTLLRAGTNSWSLAPGSQGEIFGEAVEETVHRLGELSALAWVARGGTNLAAFGFATNGIALDVELGNGTKHSVNFGGPSPSGYPCASVMIGGEPWICEIPIGLHFLVRTHLAVPEKTR